MKQEHYNIISEYLKDNLDFSYTDIADLIIGDNAIPKSHRTIRRYLQQVNDGEDFTIKPDSTIAKTVVKVKTKNEKEEKAEVHEDIVEDNFYKLKYNKEIIELDVDLADKLFCSYSRNGLNYSGPTILSVFDLDRVVFNAAVARIGLSKEADPLCPHTISKLSSVKQNERISEITEELLEKFAEADNAVTESIFKGYKKRITELRQDAKLKEEIYGHITDKLPSLKVSQYHPNKFNSSHSGILYVVIGDMHIGLETKNFNYDRAKEALESMAFVINSEVENKGFREVNLLFLGDIPHTISGVNHANMWKDIEQGLWGAEAIIKPYELLSEFVSNVHNITKIYGVGGNHGRMAQHKDLEPSDEGEKLIFYMIQHSFKDVEVIWDPDKVAFTKDNLSFVLLHGDQGQDKRPGQEIAWQLGRSDTYNLILVGHTHSRQIAKGDDGDNFRKMVCPAFCPTDSYAERLGFRALPGFLLVRENMYGLPVVSDYPLHYPKTN